MSRRRSLPLVSLGLLFLLGLAATLAAGTGRHPLALKAEQEFFTVFNGNPRARTAPLRSLWTAAVSDPADPRTWLLLGLDHLWIAAEGDKTNPTTIEHLVLAERFLARAQELDPNDRRIPSWLVPVRLSLAGLLGQNHKEAEILRDLEAAYAEDPNFHSFSIALLGVASDRRSPEFQRGLAALRSTSSGCTAADDPSCQNRPHWPHNQEAYETFQADYELKAGHADRARELLLRVRQIPTYASWPFRHEAEDRLKNLETYAALLSNADPGDDPPHLMSISSGILCQSCHLGP